MKGIRGIIVFLIAVFVGLIAVKAVSVYLGSGKTKEKRPSVAAQKTEEGQKPPEFTDSIPEGMRAVNIKVDDVSGVSQRIKKGDFVDILAVSAAGGTGGESVSRVVLQAVEVLGTTGETPKGTGRTRTDREWIMTLLVAPEEALALAAAASQARISVLARYKEDNEISDVPSVSFSVSYGLKKTASVSSDVDRQVKPGMRAVTVEVRDVDGIGGRFRRGDRVDVVVSSHLAAFSTVHGDITKGQKAISTGQNQRTITLFQDIEIVAVESGRPGEGNRTMRVTLELAPQDAEKMVAVCDALKNPTVRLVSRNRQDRGIVAATGQDPLEIFTGRREIRRVQVYRGTKEYAEPMYLQKNDN